MTYFRIRSISLATAKTFFVNHIDRDASHFPMCNRWYMVSGVQSVPYGYDYTFSVAQADGLRAILGLINSTEPEQAT